MGARIVMPTDVYVSIPKHLYKIYSLSARSGMNTSVPCARTPKKIIVISLYF